MNVRPEAVILAQRWLRKAQNDLKTAEHTLKLPDPECPFDTICFHAQQCAEKSLKAFLTLHGVVFNKIHDLKQILKLCDAIENLSEELGTIVTLSPYAVELRYPEWEEIYRAQAEEAVAIARKTYEAVRRRLRPVIGEDK